jgi:hypothetical protein
VPALRFGFLTVRAWENLMPPGVPVARCSTAVAHAALHAVTLSSSEGGRIALTAPLALPVCDLPPAPRTLQCLPDGRAPMNQLLQRASSRFAPLPAIHPLVYSRSAKCHNDGACLLPTPTPASLEVRNESSRSRVITVAKDDGPLPTQVLDVRKPTRKPVRSPPQMVARPFLTCSALELVCHQTTCPPGRGNCGMP